MLGKCRDCGDEATVEPEGILLCEMCARRPEYVPMWERIVERIKHAHFNFSGLQN